MRPSWPGLLDLLSRAGSGSAATAVIRGETGCGKTHLLNAVAERARADGWKCLHVQGVESEAVLSGAGLLSVLSPLRGGLGAVPEAQAEALSAALGWGPAGGFGRSFPDRRGDAQPAGERVGPYAAAHRR